MAEDIHPGSFVGDTIEELKKLPMWGKVLLGAAIVIVLYLLYLKFSQNQGSAPSPIAQGNLQPGIPGGSSDVQSPFPSVPAGQSSYPLLSSNTSPIYDAQGNLIAFQSQQTPTAPAQSPTASVQPAPVPSFINQPGNPPPNQSNPVKAVASYLGLLGPNAAVNFQNRTYKNSAGQWVPIPIPASDKLVQGSQNRVWYTDAGGQHLLTSGVGPAINPTTNTKVAGGGGMSWQSYLHKIRTYTIQPNDNLASRAAQLRIKGGLPAWLDFNGNPSTFMVGDTLKVPYDSLVSVPDQSWVYPKL